jgi:hypothetical protein
MTSSLVLAQLRTVPWLWLLVTCLLPRRLRFDSGSLYFGFVVSKMALGLVFLRELQLSPVSIIPQMLHTRSSSVINAMQCQQLSASSRCTLQRKQSFFIMLK